MKQHYGRTVDGTVGEILLRTYGIMDQRVSWVWLSWVDDSESEWGEIPEYNKKQRSHSDDPKPSELAIGKVNNT